MLLLLEFEIKLLIHSLCLPPYGIIKFNPVALGQAFNPVALGEAFNPVEYMYKLTNVTTLHSSIYGASWWS
jgi:hypothetical protein